MGVGRNSSIPHCNNLSDEVMSDDFDRKSQPCLKVRRRLSAIFYACYTSRKTALRSHPLSFATGLFVPCFSTPLPLSTEKDVLMFTPMATGITPAMNCLSDFRTVRHIAIEPGYLDDHGAIARLMVHAFRMVCFQNPHDRPLEIGQESHWLLRSLLLGRAFHGKY